jgi:hypothetical protein
MVRRLSAGASRIRTSGPSINPARRCKRRTPGRGISVMFVFRRAPRINPACDSAIAPGQAHPERKGRSAPDLGRCAVGSSSPSRRLPAPVTGKAAVDVGFHAVRAGLTVTFGSPRWIRHILPDHEFHGTGGRGSGLYIARYGDRYCLLCRSRTDPVTGGRPSTA